MSRSIMERRGSARRMVEVTTMRALRHAIAADYDVERAGADLARKASGPLQLRVVRQRIDRALEDRWSEVGHRARKALDHALLVLDEVPARRELRDEQTGRE